MKNISEALAAAMKKDGYELDGADRLIIRDVISGSITAQRRRESYARSAASPFSWKKKTPPRS